MTQLALTSKKFFSSHYMLNAFFISALKVSSKFYKLILASGFKKRLQRPTTSPRFVFSPLLLRFILFLFQYWKDSRKISGTHGVRVSFLSICLRNTLQVPQEAEYKCKKKEGRKGDAEIHRGEREQEVWRKKPRYRVITAISLNKHV